MNTKTCPYDCGANIEIQTNQTQVKCPKCERLVVIEGENVRKATISERLVYTLAENMVVKLDACGTHNSDVVEYLRWLVASDIQNTLDDPSFDDREAAISWHRTAAKTCESLGLDFAKVVELSGTPYEIQRLNDILEGRIDPATGQEN